MRRTTESCPTLAALALALVGCGEAPPSITDGAAAHRPSIVLVTLDTLRRDHVGLFGYARDTTPFLDAFAEECIVFDRAYTTMSWTLIAHMSLLTGLYASQHGVWDESSALSRSVPTLAERLSAQGYHTLGFYFGPDTWLSERYGFGRGFDVYVPHEGAEEAGENVRAALAELPAGEPFFLFLNLFDIHSAPVEDGVHGQTVYAPPPPWDEHFLSGAKERLAGIDAWRALKRSADDLTPAQHEALVALYDGGIRYVDEKLSQWFAEWRERGLLDDAVVVVTSDHGEGLHQRGGRLGGHGDTYEEGLRVPLLVRLPGARFAGRRVDDPVCLVDVVPTLLELLRLEREPWLPGYNLLADVPEGRAIYAERPSGEAIVQWPWKLVQDRDQTGGKLYDLERDPLELNPLSSAADGERFEELAGRLRERAAREREAWLHPRDALPATEQGAGERRALKELGYGGEADEGAD